MAYCFGVSLGVTLINVGNRDIRLQGYIITWLHRAPATALIHIITVQGVNKSTRCKQDR